jgi:DNA-binding FadR family transcriptional regulator
MGELSEGDVLPSEAEMVKQLAVSRPTLRQALRILETEHLIVVRRGSRGGTAVRGPSVRLASRYLGDLLRYRRVTLGDVVQTQLTIELAAVALFARQHDDESIAALRELLTEQHTADEGNGVAPPADKFHLRLVELAGNATLAQYARLVHYLIGAHMRRYDSARRSDGAADAHAAGAHFRLVDLIEAGAVHATINHWRKHLDEMRDHLALRLDFDTELDAQD